MNQADRRVFLSALLAGTVASRIPVVAGQSDRTGKIMTVRGPIPRSELGRFLPHEHILVDFIGADRVSPDRYRVEDVMRVALPHLERLKRQGVSGLADCTPSYLGRNPGLLKVLSERTGLHLLTNTGYYNAGGGKYLPETARGSTAEALAKIWLKEWRDGIDDTGIFPGFIKIGVDRAPLTEMSRRLVEAAARVHLSSGLTIASHTGDGAAALEQLEILRSQGVAPSAFIWVHAQSETNSDIHLKAAEQGAWVEFDGVAPDTLDRHERLVLALRAEGFLDRVLLSHDAGWYHVGEPDGGVFRSFDTLISRLTPRLKLAGFTEAELRVVTVENPAEVFTIGVRKTK